MNRHGLLFLAAMAYACSAAGQARELADREIARWQEGLRFTITTDAAHQFETDIDGGGDYDVTRFGVAGAVDFTLTDDLNLSLSFGYERDSFDFSGGAGLGALDPWDEIDMLRFGVRLRARVNERLRVFGGPVFGFSAETEADLSDGFVGGGIAGATWSFSKRLTVGGGLGVLSDIEDDVQVFPVVILDWRIAENLTLRTGTGTATRGGGGIELEWRPHEQWALALGGSYRSRRFRLDDRGIAPDGVGEEQVLPIYVRVGYRPSPNLEISVRGGVIVAGRLTLEDDDGDEIFEDDFDPAPFVGATLSLRF